MKTYHSFDKLEEDLFPNAHRKRIRDEKIKKFGIWKVLLDELLEIMEIEGDD